MSPATVAAVQVRDLIGPAGLEVVDLPAPVDADAVVVEVHAAGVSFPDLLMSQGRYQRKPPVPFVPGVEVAGRVLSAPAGSGFAPGDRVAGFTRVGGWAGQVAVRPELTFALPDRISLRAGAGMVMNYLTAHLSLTRRGQLSPGEVLVVHGAAGGLGTALVQAGRALGATVIGVVSTPAKAELALAAGADHAVLTDDWLADVRDLAPGGVQVVADPVGGERLLDSLRSLGKEGRLMVLGFAAGDIPQIPANRLLLKNVDVRGVAWGSLIEDEPDYPAQQWAEVLTWIEAGHVRPVQGPEFEHTRAAAALELLAERGATGKVTLRMPAAAGTEEPAAAGEDEEGEHHG